MRFDDERVPLSEVLSQAMAAEKAAADFYTALVPLFPGKNTITRMLGYMAHMERGHYALLADEQAQAEELENAGEAWPMFHIGP